jgi:hypothetical protein
LVTQRSRCKCLRLGRPPVVGCWEGTERFNRRLFRLKAGPRFGHHLPEADGDVKLTADALGVAHSLPLFGGCRPCIARDSEPGHDLGVPIGRKVAQVSCDLGVPVKVQRFAFAVRDR